MFGTDVQHCLFLLVMHEGLLDNVSHKPWKIQRQHQQKRSHMALYYWRPPNCCGSATCVGGLSCAV